MTKEARLPPNLELDTRSGLLVLQENIRSGLHSAMTDDFGIKISKAELGSVKFSAQPSERFLNPTGRIHRSFAATVTSEAKLVDTAGLLYAHGTGSFQVYPK